MNLDILICVMENVHADDLPYLLRLGSACRSVRKQGACTQAIRRAGLLVHVRESYRATVLHSASSRARCATWYTHKKWSLDEINLRLSRSQCFLQDYLRKTYGLRKGFRCSTSPGNRPGETKEPAFFLSDAWVVRSPYDLNARKVISDLFFLSRKGFAIVVSDHIQTIAPNSQAKLGRCLAVVMQQHYGVECNRSVARTVRARIPRNPSNPPYTLQKEAH